VLADVQCAGNIPIRLTMFRINGTSGSAGIHARRGDVLALGGNITFLRELKATADRIGLTAWLSRDGSPLDQLSAEESIAIVSWCPRFEEPALS
jgi:hypothetical protein